MEFGPRFKKLLDENGVTQKKFAEDTNTHRGYVSEVLNEKTSPSADFIVKALGYFPGVDANYFFGDILNSGKVNEPTSAYTDDNPFKLIEEIELRLTKIKRFLPQ